MGEVRNVSVPYSQPINHGLPAYGQIEVEGEAVSGGDRAIWFEFRGHGGEIPLHINIRLGSLNGRNEICVNAFDRDWGKEQFYRQSVSVGGSVYAKIVVKDKEYEVDINGREFSFRHRLPKDSVQRFEVRGDIRVNRINYTGFGDHLYIPGQGGGYPQPPSYPQPSYPTPNPGYQPPSSYPDPRSSYPPPPAAYPDQIRPYPSDPGYQPPYNPNVGGGPVGSGASIGQPTYPFGPTDSRGYN
ncbi:unnamed protein product [Bursaphelenchus xylophilus]|uniref:Galectin n=1 Tax=Bursaphelenchus xylophilus TaxID=6326 RepID=A0A1I7RHR5_BURXY|nr:unnamed protein product [Bursaphelenchus xylophilus]CAG9115464.1 unnamed protein product [Bursaphelenchus xylophilus]